MYQLFNKSSENLLNMSFKKIRVRFKCKYNAVLFVDLEVTELHQVLGCALDGPSHPPGALQILGSFRYTKGISNRNIGKDVLHISP